MHALLHAGYLLPGVFASAGALIERGTLLSRWRLCCAASVDADFDAPGAHAPRDPLLCSAANIIGRGLPTLCSVAVEQRFLEKFPEPIEARRIIDVLHGGNSPSEENDFQPAGVEPDDARARLLVRSPIAIALVQRALVEAALANALDMSAAAWTLIVVERDVPCGALAVSEFRRLLEALLRLEGKRRMLPRIRCMIVPATEFAASPLHAVEGVQLLDAHATLPAADLLIDFGFDRDVEADPTPLSAIAHRMTLRPPRDGEEQPRRFYLDAMERHAPGSANSPAEDATDGEPDADTGADEAVRTLLADCFRIPTPTVSQLRMIEDVRARRSFLAALPPAAGKSLAPRLTALLCPAPSCTVTPLASLAEDQRDQLADVFIDAIECLHEGMGLDARARARARFADRQAMILLVSAELFRTEETAAMFDALRKAKCDLSQLVIDEAQTMSEWSHDPRLAMQRVPWVFAGHAAPGASGHVPVCMLTSTHSHDVVVDLRWQLEEYGGRHVDVIVQDPDEDARFFRARRFSCQNTGSDSRNFPASRRALLADALARQRQRFLSLHAEAPLSMRCCDGEAPTEPPTLLICPRPWGPLGPTNRHTPGAEGPAVDETVAGAAPRVAVFVGKDDGLGSVGRQVFIEADESRRGFRHGRVDLMVATRAYAIGTHKTDIRCTLHIAPPVHIERLLQECGRGGRDRRFALHTVLCSMPGEPTPAHEEGSRGAGTSIPSPDFDFLRAAHAPRAGDAVREKLITSDLLREISYPEDSNTSRVANLIADEFGLSVRVRYWQRGLEERMYVQESGQGLGYVDLLTQELVPDSGYPDRILGKAVLEFAHAVCVEAAGSGPSLSSWVAATYPSDIDDGIARQLADFAPGECFTIRLGYDNDREPLLTQIHQSLWRTAGIEIQRKLFSEMHAATWAEFRHALALRVGQPQLFASLDPAIDAQLKTMFDRIRGREDTERFILRLGSLGIVRAHLSHPAARTFSLRVVARNDSEIEAALARYLERRMTRREATREMATLQERPGETVLERALSLLIDHAVGVGNARWHAQARLVETVCRIGADDGDLAFRDAIRHAASAKYALRNSLPAAIEQGQERMPLLIAWIKQLEKDRSASVRENAAHLAASCRLLADGTTDEPVLDALREFAALIEIDGIVTESARKERAATMHRFAAAFAAVANADRLTGDRRNAAPGSATRLFQRFFPDADVKQLLVRMRHALRQEDGVSVRHESETPGSRPTPPISSRTDAGAVHDPRPEPIPQATSSQDDALPSPSDAAVVEDPPSVVLPDRSDTAVHRRRPTTEGTAAIPGIRPAPRERSVPAGRPVPPAGTPESGTTRPTAARVSESPIHRDDADPLYPELRRHLDWLKNFNTHFLKNHAS